MKIITPKLLFACLLTFGAAIAAQADEKYDDGWEIISFFGNFHHRYSGSVTAVDHGLRGEAQVRLHATTEYLWAGNRFQSTRKVSKECVLRWTRTDQPVPFAAGMRVSFDAQDNGDVTAAKAYAALPYYRRRSDGLIEVLLHASVGPGEERVWLRTLPDRLNLMPAVNIGWSRQYGLVLSIFEAGGDDEEEESLRAGERGLPITNVPGERIQIGRDGWKKTPNLHAELSKGVVPPKQYIYAGG